MIYRSRQYIVIEGPQDLVVEIISTGSRKRDKIDKMEIYRNEYGARRTTVVKRKRNRSIEYRFHYYKPASREKNVHLI
jgi:Uma2 family endonuclease